MSEEEQELLHRPRAWTEQPCTQCLVPRLRNVSSDAPFHFCVCLDCISKHNSAIVQQVCLESVNLDQWDDPTLISMNDESFALNSIIDADLSDTSESPSTLNPLREPFLNYISKPEWTFEYKSAVYRSLIALVKGQYPFDDALQDRAAQFLKSLEPSWSEHDFASKLVTDIVPSSAGSPSGFIESIITLLSSPHSIVVEATLSFVYETTLHSSRANRCQIVESDLMNNLLATFQPHTLPILGNEKIISNLIIILRNCVSLADLLTPVFLGIYSTVNNFNHREMIFQKVVLPSSQFVTFLISNRHIINGDLFDNFMFLLVRFIDIGPFHRPILEFVLASPIVMAFSSCLALVESHSSLHINLHTIRASIGDWKKEGAEVVQSGRRSMQALISEGFEDTLEQTLMHKKSGTFGFSVVEDCLPLSKLMGSNVKLTENDDDEDSVSWVALLE
ncbi:hypothetical protein BLNAU_6119 [Blattamonas nauphoetae]|uniref:Uncharacterized protein n=1 Tax=Blattamonas nauphoetae TaxID=2049346 RepID=A0ABQ9Y546_9EUKA|nr:hypothetical protein BLNAU_6119 [Blattamonas nauphoetae]